MGNSKTKPEVVKSSNNLGLINLEENNLGTMGPFEIAMVILLVLWVLVLCHYCHQKCKKSRMRAMNTAVQEGMSRETGNASNTAVGVPMVTFEQPGTRIVSDATSNSSIRSYAASTSKQDGWPLGAVSVIGEVHWLMNMAWNGLETGHYK